MSTVNCGAHFLIDGVVYEAMSVEYSSHPTNIISLYLPNGHKKVEISGWLAKDNDYENMKFGIAYYRSSSSLGSIRYTQKISAKWLEYKEQIIAAHKAIFNGSCGV